VHPQKIWLVNNPGKIHENLDKIPENLVKSMKIRAETAPNVVRFEEMTPKVGRKTHEGLL